MDSNCYLDGSYLTMTGGTWHLEDASFKANQSLKMLTRQNISPSTICEVGCGAGGILAELQKSLGPEVKLVGYEISPQAHELSRRFSNDRLTYVLGSAFADGDTYDLAMAMDVIEHVEDVFTFLRDIKGKATYKLFHIPLEICVWMVLRDHSLIESWRSAGHIHKFLESTALEILRHAGHEIQDSFLTPNALSHPPRDFKNRVVNWARRLVGTINPRLSNKLLGGYSLMVLTR